MQPNETTEEFFDRVQSLIDRGNYADAIVVLEKHAPVFEANQEWENFAKCLVKHCECFWRDGKYHDGIALADRGLAVCLATLGELHEHSAACHNSLGVCYMLQTQNDKSLFHLQKALEIRQQVCGENALLVGVSLLSLGNLYMNMQDYVMAIDCHLQAYTIFKQVQPAPKRLIGLSANNLGACLVDIGQYDKALPYYTEALSKYNTVFGEHNPNTAFVYNNLSIVYAEMGNLPQALYYAQKSLEVKTNTLSAQHPDMVYSIFTLGATYQAMGDSAHALLYYKKVFKLAQIVLPNNYDLISKIDQNIAVCFFETGNHTQAIKHLEQALQLQIANSNEANLRTAQLYFNLGINYRKLHQQGQALDYLHRALNNLLSLPFKQYHDISLCYTAIGNCHVDMGSYATAISQYEEAASGFLQVFGGAHPSIATLYSNVANCYILQKQYEQALRYLQQSLAALALPADLQNYHHLPPLQHYNSATELLFTLSEKGRVLGLLYQQNQQLPNLAAAIAHFTAADNHTDQLRLLYKAEGSKQSLAKKAKEMVYDAGLEVLWLAEMVVTSNADIAISENISGYKLPNAPIQTAFHFSEKSKATLLFAAITDAQARFDAQLPADLLEQEYDLRLQLTYLKRRIAEEAYIAPDERNTADLQEWHEQYFDLHEAYLALIAKMEADYPNYYLLKYDCNTAHLTAIQAALPPHTAMLSYVLSEQYLYILVVTQINSHWIQYALPEDFEGLLEDFRNTFEPLSDEDFVTYAYDMYRHLIQPIAQWLTVDITRLVIIPDGILTQVPFEALLTEPCEWNTPVPQLPFLLQQYTITYHYSATLWLHQQTHRQTPQPTTATTTKDFIGFAPVYSPVLDEQPDWLNLVWNIETEAEPEELIARSSRIDYKNTEGILPITVEGRNCKALPYSKEEVCRVQDLFSQNRQNANVLLHQAANLDAFKTLAGNYRYMLIAAHADYIDAQPEKTGIIFAPNPTNGKAILYVSDSYNLRLQAELVVLSCCETGLGKIVAGEGVMALNRGFLFSGAKNVVYTLFKIYDKASQMLSEELFTALLQGQAPADALSYAKRRLIAKGYKHYWWAGFLLVGESIG